MVVADDNQPWESTRPRRRRGTRHRGSRGKSSRSTFRPPGIIFQVPSECARASSVSLLSCVRDTRMISFRPQSYGHRMIVFRSIRKPGERAKVGPAEEPPRFGIRDHAPILERPPLPLASPDNGGSPLPVRGHNGPEHVPLDHLRVRQSLPDQTSRSVDHVGRSGHESLRGRHRMCLLPLDMTGLARPRDSDRGHHVAMQRATTRNASGDMTLAPASAPGASESVPGSRTA